MPRPKPPKKRLTLVHKAAAKKGYRALLRKWGGES
jgi:hypothetical protein